MAHDLAKVRNPGPFQVPSSLKTLFVVFALVGAGAFAAGLSTDSTRTWATFLQNHFYFMLLGLGGLFFAAIQWLTGAMWSAPVRRVSESFTAYLPFALLAFVVIAAFGMQSLYPWTHPEIVKGNIVLEGKAGYLNLGFFVVRNVIAFGLWIYFAWKMVGNSIAQDKDGDIRFTDKNRVLAPAFLIVFALTLTMSAFDQIMSLDPIWFSTMFGVYAFAGLFYSNLAITCMLAIYLRRKGALAGIVNDNHLHDLGKFMFAFTVFWAYIGFSQFMLIWYANLPEETGWYITRFHGGWGKVSIFLLLGKFMLPFFILLPRDSKRNEKILLAVGTWMLICQWIDVLWMIQPEFFKDGPHVGWIELGTFLGFAGVFGLLVSRFLGKNNVVAIGDPRLAESVFHHHQ